MVAALVGGHKLFDIGLNHVVFQFAHRLILHAGHLGESLGSLGQRVLGSTVKRIAVLVEVRAQQGECGYFREWVDESGAETRKHIQVAAAGLNKAEKARTIHTFTIGQNGVQIIQVVNNEVQSLQPAITTRIKEIDHLDVILLDKRNDVFFCKLRSRLIQKSHYFVSTHS